PDRRPSPRSRCSLTTIPTPRTPNPSLRAAALHAAPLSLPAAPPRRRPPPRLVKRPSSPSSTPPPPATQSRSMMPSTPPRPCRSRCCRHPQRLPHPQHLRREGVAQARCGGAAGQQHHDKLVTALAAVPSVGCGGGGSGRAAQAAEAASGSGRSTPYLACRGVRCCTTRRNEESTARDHDRVSDACAGVSILIL
ncbi:unnamed protein product, partial [Urochloa humidicola]